MFTGIVTGVGRIVALHDLGNSALFGKRLAIDCPPGYVDDIVVGDSIALDGACLTAAAVNKSENRFWVEVSAESLALTHGLDRAGTVNLEKAVRAHDRLGGHILSGHVDGVATVTSFQSVGESRELRLLAPKHLARYLALKGSVAVNGVSLTVNSVQDSATGCEISVNLIAHTLQHTTLADLAKDSKVNLEIDLVARYVERMVSNLAVGAPGTALGTAR